jgi:hypothetical protein
MYRLHYGEGLSYERISAVLNVEGVPSSAYSSTMMTSAGI